MEMTDEQPETATEWCARVNRVRYEQDRKKRRGYDVDCRHPEHREFLERAGQDCACLKRQRAAA
jgi:hypothetical protein